MLRVLEDDQLFPNIDLGVFRVSEWQMVQVPSLVEPLLGCPDIHQQRSLKRLFDPGSRKTTLPETNIAPETLGLEDEFPFGQASCQVLC